MFEVKGSLRSRFEATTSVTHLQIPSPLFTFQRIYEAIKLPVDCYAVAPDFLSSVSLNSLPLRNTSFKVTTS